MVNSLSDGNDGALAEAQRVADEAFASMEALNPDSSSLLVLGIGSGAFLNRLLVAYGPSSPADEPKHEALPTKRVPLWVVEPDDSLVQQASAQYDWSLALQSGQLQIFSGENALHRLEQAIAEPWAAPPTQFSSSPDTQWDQRGMQAAVERVTAAANRRGNAVRALAEVWRAQHAEPTGGAWRERYDEGKKIKVLLLSTRFSLFTRHCVSALGRAFERLGHDAHVLLESSDAQRLGPQVLQETVHDLAPDLIVTINYPRNFFHRWGCNLDGIPLCSWVQDPPIELRRAEAHSHHTELDFFFSNVREYSEEIEQLGFGTAPILMVPTDPEVFAPGEPTERERERYGCDVSYVSTILERVVSDLFRPSRDMQDPRAQRMYETTYRIVEERLANGDSPPTPQEYRDIILQFVGTTTPSPSQEAGVKQMMVHLEDEVGRMAIRGLPVEWLVRAGHAVGFYGLGWEEHPVLGEHLRGVIPYGPPLATLLRASSLHLCNHEWSMLTMKFFDCSATGTLPLVRWVDPERDTFPIADRYEEDRDIICFRSREELLDKARYYLSHPGERQRIAARGREITLRNFTYTHAAETMLSGLRQHLRKA